MTDSADVSHRLEYLRRWARGEKAPPMSLTLGTTYVCNLRCRFCAQRPGTAEDDKKKVVSELPGERLISLVREAAEMGVKAVCISGGGEPFLRPCTLDMMREIKAGCMEGSVTTNGTLMSGKTTKEMVRIGWDHVVVSIDGPDPETHDYLRDRHGIFERTTRTVKLLVKWKQEYGSNSPRITMNTVLVNRNHHRIHEMIELAHNLGVQSFTLVPVTVHHNEGEALRMGMELWGAFQESLSSARALAVEYGIDSNLGDFGDPSLVIDSNDMIDNFLIPEKDRSETQCPPKASLCSAGEGKDVQWTKIPCYKPWTSLVIHPDGYLDPCEMAHNVSHVGERSLKEIWYNDKHLNNMRREFLKRRLPESCAKCCGPQVSLNVELRNRLRAEKV